MEEGRKEDAMRKTGNAEGSEGKPATQSSAASAQSDINESLLITCIKSSTPAPPAGGEARATVSHERRRSSSSLAWWEAL